MASANSVHGNLFFVSPPADLFCLLYFYAFAPTFPHSLKELIATLHTS